MEPSDFLTQALAIMKAGGPLAAIVGGLVLLLVRFLRAPFVQGLLPARLKWENLSPTLKLLLPFSLASLATLVPALLMGKSKLQALGEALMAGLEAVALHHVTKAAGSALDYAGTPQMTPSPIRRAVSPILPINEKAFLQKLKVVK